MILIGLLIFGFICFMIGYGSAPKVPVNKPKLKYVAERVYDVKQTSQGTLFIIEKDVLDSIIKKNVYQYGATYTAEAVTQHLLEHYVDLKID
jgi:hypothetical protein